MEETIMSARGKLFVASSSIVTLVAIGAAVLGAAVLAAAPSDKSPWKITGQLEEACNCNAACPCWFGSKPTKMMCGGGQVLFIENGTYGDVKLDGLAVANAAQSPKGEAMMDSFGKWNFSYIYVDEKADAAQRKALAAIGSAVLPLGGSPNTKIRYVPITRTINGSEHEITIGSYGKFHGHTIEGGLGGPAKILNPPGADPLHKEYAQGVTTMLTYNDAGQDWKESGTNYMFGTFTVDSTEYEKYAAGLAQKMEAMKAGKKN
jgi:hypothetical protein